MIAHLLAVSLIFHIQSTERSVKTLKLETYMDVCSAVYVSPTEALTAAHCLEYTTGNMWIKDSDGRSFRATVEKKDIHKDLALLKVNGPAHEYVELGSAVDQGQPIYIMANGGDMAFTYGEGIVNNLLRDQDAFYTLQILHSATIIPGASGSGVFNKYGNLVGLNVATIKGFSVAVDLSEIKSFLYGREMR